jgi:hypothetical protein
MWCGWDALMRSIFLIGRQRKTDSSSFTAKAAKVRKGKRNALDGEIENEVDPLSRPTSALILN